MTTQEWISLLTPVLISLGLAAAWQAIAVMKKRGYQTAYAEALLRAVGAGVLAAQSKGIGAFTPEGRAIVLAVGTHYMQTTVPDASAGLGIQGDAAHEKRLDAQLGVLAGQAQAAAAVPASVIQVLPVGGLPLRA